MLLFSIWLEKGRREWENKLQGPGTQTMVDHVGVQHLNDHTTWGPQKLAHILRFLSPLCIWANPFRWTSWDSCQLKPSSGQIPFLCLDYLWQYSVSLLNAQESIYNKIIVCLSFNFFVCVLWVVRTGIQKWDCPALQDVRLYENDYQIYTLIYIIGHARVNVRC